MDRHVLPERTRRKTLIGRMTGANPQRAPAATGDLSRKVTESYTDKRVRSSPC
jgi:hypothetical protein